MHFEEPFFVGLAACAHDNNAIESAIFSNVTITPISTPTNATSAQIESVLETVTVGTVDHSMDRRVIYQTTNHIEAPNWSRDGTYFLFNGNGRIYKLAVTNGTPQLLDTGTAIKCNNDHGISPDGTQFAVSDQTVGGKSRIYLLPIDGGAARQITPLAPSYWHGWSPDGKTLAFCGQRTNEFDIYTIPAAGGEETRLTTAKGLDDGPDYSPDGKYIYFNSEHQRPDANQRMKPDDRSRSRSRPTITTTGSRIPRRTAGGSCLFPSRRK